MAATVARLSTSLAGRGARGRGRLARERVRKRRDIVAVYGKTLRALGEVVPLHPVECVILRVVVFFVVRNFLNAPRRGHAFSVERNVIAAAFAAQAGFGKPNRLVVGQRV